MIEGLVEGAFWAAIEQAVVNCQEYIQDIETLEASTPKPMHESKELRRRRKERAKRYKRWKKSLQKLENEIARAREKKCT